MIRFDDPLYYARSDRFAVDLDGHVFEFLPARGGDRRTAYHGPAGELDPADFPASRRAELAAVVAAWRGADDRQDIESEARANYHRSLFP